MNLIVQQRLLREALAHMGPITEPYDARDPKSGKFRPHFEPTMVNVRITAESGLVQCEVSDGRSAIRSVCAATVTDDGEVSLPRVNLQRALDAMPDRALRIQHEHGEVHLDVLGGHRTIRLLSGEPNPSRMPAVPTLGWMRLDGEIFISALRRVMTCVSTDIDRPHVNSLLLKAEGGVLALVSTDGHRLAVEEIAVNPHEIDGWEWLVPLAACQVLVGLLSDKAPVLVAAATPNVFFKVNDERVYCARRVDAQFPPYTHAIPASYASEAIVDRDELLQAMSFAAMASPHRDDGVAVCFVEGGLRVASRSYHGASSAFLLGSMVGEVQRIGASVHYMIDAVRQVPTEKVRLQLPQAGRDFGNVAEPVCISPVYQGDTLAHFRDFREIIMPRRMEDPEL